MCVAFDKLSIYQYLFALDDQNQNSISELSGKEITIFCNLLYKYISEKEEINPCYKYVYFRGFDSADAVDFSLEKYDFIEILDKVLCMDVKGLEGMSKAIEEKYTVSYHDDDTIANALRKAKKEVFENFIHTPVQASQAACV